MRIAVKNQYAYLMRLSQHLSLYRTKNLSRLYQEEDIIQSILQYTNDTNILQTQLSMISVIHLYMNHQSEVIKTHQSDISAWLDNAREQTGVLKHIAEKTARVFSEYCAS
ncbi:MAG: hypothetical protein QNK11_09505 [Legionella sp.]|nr:hypothetical protein [Legionella sp.]